MLDTFRSSSVAQQSSSHRHWRCCAFDDSSGSFRSQEPASVSDGFSTVQSLTSHQGGIGANTAVRDSALLGGLLADAGGYADMLTKKYEEKMRVYASAAVKSSYGLATTGFGVSIDEESTPTV